MATATTPQPSETTPAPAGADAAAAATPAPASNGANGATPASAPAATPAPAAAPSLLAGADAGKREGAPKPESKADAKGAEAKPAEVKPAETKPEPAAAKPAEAAPPTEAKPAEAKPAEAPAAETKPAEALPTEAPAAPVYDALRLPENVRLDEKSVKEFDAILGKLETAGKADHALTSAARQELVDFYLKEREQLANDALKYQRDVWSRYNEQMISKMKADPELGGNRLETTLGNAKHAFETYSGLTKAQQDELMVALDNGGISNNPLFIRLFNNLFVRFAEPQPVSPNLPGAPSKDRGQRNWYEKIDGQAA